jgi:hypothetical protein
MPQSWSELPSLTASHLGLSRAQILLSCARLTPANDRPSKTGFVRPRRRRVIMAKRFPYNCAESLGEAPLPSPPPHCSPQRQTNRLGDHTRKIPLYKRTRPSAMMSFSWHFPFKIRKRECQKYVRVCLFQIYNFLVRPHGPRF